MRNKKKNRKTDEQMFINCKDEAYCDSCGTMFCRLCSRNADVNISLNGSMHRDWYKPSPLKDSFGYWRWLFNEDQHKEETMKTDEIYTDANGKKFRLVPVEEELTLEDCIKRNRIGCCNSSPYDATMAYPTEAIAEKVLLYGLLQSVAYKLNGGKHIENGYCITMFGGEFTFTTQHFHSGNVIFETQKLAEQAISIFAKSKFDLKKLYQ